MLRSLKIGQFFGIGVYIHWTFFLLPLWAIINLRDSPISPLTIVGLIAAIFTCVVLHEFGHALTARLFGIGTRDITLYPIGGVARLERMSEKPWEEFWIAVGGPAVNVLIALLLIVGGIAIARIDPSLIQFPTEGGFTSTTGLLFWNLLFANIIMILFNMLPVFPMDGGRVFRSILSMWVGQLKATRIAAFLGVPVAILVLIPLAWMMGSPWLFVVVLFVLIAGQQELRYVEWKHQQKWEEEPIPAVPVANSYGYRSSSAYTETPRANVPMAGFAFQPTVAVYIWDNQMGAWVKEPNPG